MHEFWHNDNQEIERFIALSETPGSTSLPRRRPFPLWLAWLFLIPMRLKPFDILLASLMRFSW